MTDLTVKYFASSMSGAPSIAGNVAGGLIAVLDACLINGFGSVTINPLVVAANVATCTVSAGHGFSMYGSTGSVITISGCTSTSSAINGTYRIASVPDSTHFTFITSGIADQTATGTITAIRTHAGWSKGYSGTNLAAYQSTNVAANAGILRVDDSGTTGFARVRGYKTMSDINTGTDPYPTDAQVSGGGYWWRSNTADASTRAWQVYADPMNIIITTQPQGNARATVEGFGDLISDKSGDAYNGVLTYASSNPAAVYHIIGIDTSNGNRAACRSYTGSSGAVALLVFNAFDPQIAMAYPCAVNNNVYVAHAHMFESSSLIRGAFPGLWVPMHVLGSMTHLTVLSNVTGLSGKDLMLNVFNQQSMPTVGVCVDLTGPWRNYG